MTIETLQQKVENQRNHISQLTDENEKLFHQFNHLMVRNAKLLKRVDDLQNIIDDLHVRIEELQLINSNMMQLNDNLRRRNEIQFSAAESQHLQSRVAAGIVQEMKQFNAMNLPEGSDDHLSPDKLFKRWKNYPGQEASNAPNLRKQMLMLVQLYNHKKLRAQDLFNLTGVGGVTGARYVSVLKKYDFIHYTGARKKGHYEIAEKGREFIEAAIAGDELPESQKESAIVAAARRGIQARFAVPAPVSSTDKENDL